jgi:hypothetical protein
MFTFTITPESYKQHPCTIINIRTRKDRKATPQETTTKRTPPRKESSITSLQRIRHQTKTTIRTSRLQAKTTPIR